MNIESIRKLIEKKRIKWSQHILTRMQQRGIKIEDVLHSIKKGEIIEEYSDDYPYPSVLIFGNNKDEEIIHTVCGVGVDYIWMITTYYPDSEEWMDDFKTRR